MCEQPLQATNVHTTEAFGPVCTLMPYQNIEELADLVSRGEGSLVASVVKNNDENMSRLFKKLRLGMDVCMYLMQSQQKKVQVMVLHFRISTRRSWSCRCGEELGGIRAVKHYMQRTAIQGSQIA